ncbi:MAG: magnesium/cobalt transporter CorA [Asgard group archaeon]|nr:magnesium/cobalt transporter CorA [Asgard group archaeon]
MFFPKKKRNSKAGLPPGSIVYTGEREAESIYLTALGYNEKDITHKKLEKIEEFFELKKESAQNWLIVEGVHQVENIEKIGGEYNLHPLVLEDIVNVFGRSKIDTFDEYLCIIMKMFQYSSESNQLEEDQISLLLTHDSVISFSEKQSEIFTPVINRIISGYGRIRKTKNDYLLYSLIDIVVDNYFLVLEQIGLGLSDIEEELVSSPNQNTLIQIQYLKRNIIHLRKTIFPVREILNSIIRGDATIIEDSTMLYFRDVYDHVIRIIETIESYRDMVSGLLDIYLSSVSNKMNEIMKVLTIIATIFIPLTFIAGIYGMNFLYMPELQWQWGYLFVWIIMIIITGFMIFYFRKRKWI